MHGFAPAIRRSTSASNKQRSCRRTSPRYTRRSSTAKSPIACSVIAGEPMSLFPRHGPVPRSVSRSVSSLTDCWGMRRGQESASYPAGHDRQPTRPLRGHAVRRTRTVSRATPSCRHELGDTFSSRLTPPSHPVCRAAARTASSRSYPARRAVPGAQPPGDLEFPPRTFRAGDQRETNHVAIGSRRLALLFRTSPTCCPTLYARISWAGYGRNKSARSSASAGSSPSHRRQASRGRIAGMRL